MRAEARGKGVATRLLGRPHDELGGVGADRVLVETLAGAPAENFYRRSGYDESAGSGPWIGDVLSDRGQVELTFRVAPAMSDTPLLR